MTITHRTRRQQALGTFVFLVGAALLCTIVVGGVNLAAAILGIDQ